MKNFIVKKSRRGGLGVFACRTFAKGFELFKCRGKLFTKSHLARQSVWTREHSAQIGENLWLGPAHDVEDYVNHSCNPNAGHQIKGRETTFVAIKKIEKGQEITFDYSTTMYKTGEVMPCSCGSSHCRKKIKDFEHLPKKLQIKYFNLGIVPRYIVKKVLHLKHHDKP